MTVASIRERLQEKSKEKNALKKCETERSNLFLAKLDNFICK